MHIGCYDLNPTYRDVNNYLSVKYYLKLVIIDEEDRHYTKQQEIYLWGKHL
jgi:vacuolar protein sorting-associated protein 26